MRRMLRLVPLVFAAALVVAVFGAGGSWSSASAAKADVVADSYIVTFKPGVEPVAKASQKAKAYGLQVRHVYKSTIKGFSAVIPPGQLKKLQSDPDVLTIVEDRRVYTFNDQRPMGIRRSQADRNATAQIGSHTNPIDVDVAVVDTGIDPGHPDLNVVGGISCVPGESSYADLNGHGTHVAGTVAALDNGVGVVGVAPGARLWAVRVLNAAGEGQFSDVICGIDWVTANAGTIDVVNMSLGGEEPVDSCSDGSLHAAICQSVDAGVTYVVAAGNSAMDSSNFVPAAYPEVITVSAIADTDGRPGGDGPTSWFYGNDEELASFSNFGAPVDIAAPGVNIYSTSPGGYTYLSGTSMASPHVAGAAAVYLYLNPGASPASVKSYLLSIAWAQNSADGFTNDVDNFPEPLLNAGAVGGPPLPPIPPACTLSANEGTVGSTVQVQCAEFAPSEYVRIYWDSTATTQRAGFVSSVDGSGTVNLSIPDGISGEHQIIARGSNSGIEFSLPFTVNPGVRTLQPSGKVGAFTVVTLNGFGAGEALSVTWDGGNSPIATATASATGAASVSLTIPESVAGAHVLTATGQSGASAEASFTVVPGVSLTLPIGRVGTVTTINLRGYAAGEQITATWQIAGTNKTQIGQVTASALGSASIPFTVPDATKGAHLIEGTGGTGNVGSTTFTVSSAMVLSATSGTVGSNLTVTLSGFGANESVALKWFDTSTTFTTITTVVASAQGGNAVTIPVPEAINGGHRLDAVGTSSGTTSAYFFVMPAVVLDPATGEAGTTVDATLTGYRAGEAITIKWFSSAFTSTTIATSTASAKGTGTASFQVPADATGGDHKVEATGGASYARGSANFAVTFSGPPPSTDPTCTIDSASGTVGTRVAVTCSNFQMNEFIRIYWDSTATSAKSVIWTGSAGGGSAAFTIPDTTAGPHQIIALGGTSNYQIQQTFTVTPSVRLSSTSVKVGAFLTATLRGFAANESVTLTWDGGATLKTVTVDANGSAGASFAVPEAPRGDHTVNALGVTSATPASATATIVPSLALSPPMGISGSATSALLRGYGAGEDVSIEWFDTETLSTQVATTTISALGSGSVQFTVPEAVGGNHRVDATGDAGSTATASYRVTASFVMAPTSGTVGSSFDVTLTGFAGGESIAVQWFETSTSSATIATLTASETGSASATVAVPESVGGLHRVQATGASSATTASQYFVVRAGLSLNPVSGPVDTLVTVTMTGYKAGETVSVAWFKTAFTSNPVASGVANGLGSATASFTVPGNAAEGDHKVEATGKSSYARASANFVVTAAAGTGTPDTQDVAPTFDTTVTDGFSDGDHGSIPPGWSVAPGSADSISVGTQGNRLNVTAAPGSGGSVVVIRDGATYSSADVQVNLRVNRDGSGAGVVLAWNGPNDYIAVRADPVDERLELIEVVGGVARTSHQTDKGSIDFDRNRAYWLRAEAGANWINLYWSVDGSRFEPVGVVENLLNLSGGVGLTAGGASVPDVDFDDFIARKSQSTGPILIEVDEPAPTEAPVEVIDPTPVPTEEPATPEPAPTEEPTATEEPAPTEEPTATPEPTVEPEPTLEPTPTPEPPTEEAAPEPPADGESTPEA